MDNIAGQNNALKWAVNISVLILVIAWLIPTVGLFVSSCLLYTSPSPRD